jgi:hypothetical protein
MAPPYANCSANAFPLRTLPSLPDVRLSPQALRMRSSLPAMRPVPTRPLPKPPQVAPRKPQHRRPSGGPIHPEAKAAPPRRLWHRGKLTKEEQAKIREKRVDELEAECDEGYENWPPDEELPLYHRLVVAKMYAATLRALAKPPSPPTQCHTQNQCESPSLSSNPSSNLQFISQARDSKKKKIKQGYGYIHSGQYHSVAWCHSVKNHSVTMLSKYKA